MLRELVAAGAPITHAALDHHGTDIPVEHLRSILVHTGAFQPRGNAVDSVAPWLDTLVADLSPELAATVRAYASWSVLRRARGRAARGHLGVSAPQYARVTLQIAVQFLTWLTDHHHTLAESTQADVDRWLGEGASTRHRLRDFLRWAHQHDRAATLRVSWLGRDGLPSQLLADDERWSALRRCLTDDGLDLWVRIAGVLVLLYGQIPPASSNSPPAISPTTAEVTAPYGCAIVPSCCRRLTTELTSRPDRRRRGAPPSTTPEWLFPGRRPGAHLDSGRLALLLRTAGIPVRPARGAALAALAADLPAPVLADLLGISVSAATRWSALAVRGNAEYLAARVEHPPH